MSGSGVLLGGEMASGVITILGFSCRGKIVFFYFFILQDLIAVEYMIYSKSAGAELIINLQMSMHIVDCVLSDILQKKFLKFLNCPVLTLRASHCSILQIKSSWN